MSWQAGFEALTAHLRAVAGQGTWTASLVAEDTDFVRFTQGRVRQAGSVAQASLELRWVEGRRHASEGVTLTGQPDEDRARVNAALAALQAIVPSLPEDPHLLLDTEAVRDARVESSALPSAEEVVSTVVGLAAAPSPVDLVGIWQAGGMHRAFASSFGHERWFTTHSLCLDWSLVHDADRAVKRTFGGTTWVREALAAEMDAARAQLARLALPPRTLPPGRYRAWLAPAAMGELLELYAYGDFGARAQATRASALGRLVDGEASLHASVYLSEDAAGGTAPPFQAEGFQRPDEVALIAAGRHAGALISPRSAVEYGLRHNGADAGESPVALRLAGGTIASDEALAALDTGIWVSNLWYLNHSDRNAARVTGMTRFATFWVEGGRIVAPLAVMRFDDSVYDLLGSRLVGLSSDVSLLPSTSTYGARSASSVRTPAALVEGITFTL